MQIRMTMKMRIRMKMRMVMFVFDDRYEHVVAAVARASKTPWMHVDAVSSLVVGGARMYEPQSTANKNFMDGRLCSAAP